MRIRTQARECAVQVLYQVELTKCDWQEAYDDYFSTNDQSFGIKKFTSFLVEGIVAHSEKLDEPIKKYARNWDLDRMAIIDRNVLRLGIFELLYVIDIPPKVSINEAVELAKKFGDLDSAKFVNGILDSVFRNEKKEENAVESPREM